MLIKPSPRSEESLESVGIGKSSKLKLGLFTSEPSRLDL